MNSVSVDSGIWRQYPDFSDRQLVASIIEFLRATFAAAQIKTAVIAVSGGIDSALVLSLLVTALGPENVRPLLLPYGQQEMTDAAMLVEALKIPTINVRTINIEGIVSAAVAASDPNLPPPRHGNLMARARMMLVFDQAKAHLALVCGTENLSEHYLGYFTRFGDAASDLEPISHLLKTTVRSLAVTVGLPDVFLEKAPSAGLWPNQTDEQELGFSYQDADRVIDLYDQGITDLSELRSKLAGVTTDEVTIKVWRQIKAQAFKHQVPYCFNIRERN